MEGINLTEQISINQVIKEPTRDDLVGFEGHVPDDIKPYIQEMIGEFSNGDESQKMLGCFDSQNGMIGVAFFLEDNSQSIYLSRLVTEKSLQNTGVATSIIDELKNRYSLIRTVPLPLGDDYDKPGMAENLRRFYIKRGFVNGELWNKNLKQN